MIEFQGVSKIYNGKPALDNVTLVIKPKEFMSLVGQSGAGKTTLLKMLLREEYPTSGYVFFDGKNVLDLPNREVPFLRRRIGSVFQDYKLLTNRTASENIAFAMEAAGAPDDEIKEVTEQVLDIVGLSEQANNFPHQLSGGEQQRVSIARALVNRPQVILADEPTGNLDPINTFEIIKLLLRINELGTTVILATHNKEIINSLGRRVVVLEKGKVVRDDEKGRYSL